MPRYMPGRARALLLLAFGGALVLPVNALASDLYVSNEGSNTISPFSIGAGGGLTPIPCPGSSYKTGSRPSAVVMSPNGQLLCVANNESNTVSPFSIGPEGALTRSETVKLKLKKKR
jgi:DNA-binding beta-propeller fold protein YncE